MSDDSASNIHIRLAMLIGHAIRDARQGLGWTLADVAELMGIPVTEYASIECGRTVPDILLLSRIANALHVDIAPVLGTIPRPEPAAGHDLATRIGTAARNARLDRDLTQERVAERIGSSTEFYARIESGRALPSTQTLERMATVLQVSTQQLLEGTPSARTTSPTRRVGAPRPRYRKRELAATIGQTACAARCERDWTQEHVAQRLGVSVGHYARIERGDILPGVRTLVVLSAVLQVQAAVLLGLDRDRH